MPGRVIAYIIFAFASTFSHGQTTIPERVEQVNRAVKEAGQPKENCNLCNVAAAGLPEHKSKVQECVESLCPDSTFSISHLLDKAHSRAAGSDKVFDLEIAPIIKKIAAENAREEVATVDATLDWLKTAPPISDTESIRIFNLFTTLGKFQSFEFKETNGTVVVDEAKSRKVFPKMTEQEFKRHVAIANTLKDAYIKTRPLEYSDPGVLRILYPEGQLAEKIKEVAADLRTRWAAVSGSQELQAFEDVSFFKKMVNEKEIGRILSSGEINSEAVEALNGTAARVSIFEKLLNDQKFRSQLTSPSIDVKSFAQRRNLAQQLSNRRKIKDAILKNGHPQLLAKCRTAYAMAQEFLPTANEISSFKKNEAAVRSKFKSGIGQFISTQSKGTLDPVIDKWFFTYPPTKQAHLANMKQSLSATADEAANWQTDNRLIDQSKYKNQIYAFRLASFDKKDDETISDADYTCGDLMPSVVSDSAYPPNGGFTVGPLVLRNPKSEGIMFHEMAHLLFGVMKNMSLSQHTKAWFDKSRACISKIHGKTSDPEKYVSEDWADFLSSLVSKDGYNLACIFARNIDSSEYSGYSLKNIDEVDDHSSYLFRLLNISYLVTNQISPICTAALKEIKETPSFINCAAK